MSDSILTGMIAFQQALMLIGGFICLGIGGLLAGNALFWRAKALRVVGIIAGVRQKDRVLYPVYRYQLPSGDTFESTAEIGSAAASGKETGRAVALLVFADDPSAAKPADSFAQLVMGFFFLLPGLGLICLAVIRYDVTEATWFMLTAFALYAIIKIKHFAAPKGRRLSVQSWKDEMKRKHAQDMRGLPVQRVEDIVATATPPAEALEKKQKAAKSWGPAFICVGAILIMAGVRQGNRLEVLVDRGLKAQGQVVRLQEDTSAILGSTSFVPVVTFRTAQGGEVSFHGDGDNPPEFQEGDQVAVLYLAADPAHSAMIDRGSMNYVASLVPLATGTLLSVTGLVILRRKSRKA